MGQIDNLAHFEVTKILPCCVSDTLMRNNINQLRSATKIHADSIFLGEK